MRFLYTLDINSLADILFANIFFHSVCCLFIWLMIFAPVPKIFGLVESHLFIFTSIAYPPGVTSKKVVSSPMSKAFNIVLVLKPYPIVILMGLGVLRLCISLNDFWTKLRLTPLYPLIISSPSLLSFIASVLTLLSEQSSHWIHIITYILFWVLSQIIISWCLFCCAGPIMPYTVPGI